MAYVFALRSGLHPYPYGEVSPTVNHHIERMDLLDQKQNCRWPGSQFQQLAAGSTSLLFQKSDQSVDRKHLLNLPYPSWDN